MGTLLVSPTGHRCCHYPPLPPRHRHRTQRPPKVHPPQPPPHQRTQTPPTDPLIKSRFVSAPPVSCGPPPLVAPMSIQALRDQQICRPIPTRTSRVTQVGFDSRHLHQKWGTSFGRCPIFIVFVGIGRRNAVRCSDGSRHLHLVIYRDIVPVSREIFCWSLSRHCSGFGVASLGSRQDGAKPDRFIEEHTMEPNSGLNTQCDSPASVNEQC